MVDAFGKIAGGCNKCAYTFVNSLVCNKENIALILALDDRPYLCSIVHAAMSYLPRRRILYATYG